MEQNKVKVLLVGAAFSADLHMEGYARCKDVQQSLPYVIKITERIKNLAKRYGIENYQSFDNYEDAIAEVDCDLVDICLPNFLHKDVASKHLKKVGMLFLRSPLLQQLKMQKKCMKQV